MNKQLLSCSLKGGRQSTTVLATVARGPDTQVDTQVHSSSHYYLFLLRFIRINRTRET